MTTSIIIAICILLLLAYLFDISSPLTKIPSVIFLLILGFAVRQIGDFFKIQIIDLNPVLPILGTIGLILIVLEGSLELEINQSKTTLIKKSLLNALVQIIILGFV
jgi:Kef-type K+ transport system membrane component KefB